MPFILLLFAVRVASAPERGKRIDKLIKKVGHTIGLNMGTLESSEGPAITEETSLILDGY